MKNKVFVLGWDGATWDVLNPLINQGLLPNLKKLKEKSAFGDLQSTLPPMSPPAWTSFLTGCNPGKHGIFGFTKKKTVESYTQVSVNASDIKIPSILHTLSKLDKKVISINVPMTFPVAPVNGILISGLMTPSMESQFCYPDEIYEELVQNGIDYRIETKFKAMITDMSEQEKEEIARQNNGKDFIDDILDLSEKRFMTVKYLLENKEWDFFVVVFVGVDRICHFLWEYLPLSEGIIHKKISRNIVRFFSCLDGFLGNLLDIVTRESNTTFMMISDHGFGPYEGNLYLNTWLMKSGFLFKKQGVSSRAQKHLRKWLKLILRKLKLMNFTKKFIRSFKDYDDLMKSMVIDWTKSKAYVSSINAININLQGRELHGSVSQEDYEKVRDEIICALQRLSDKAGHHLIKKAHKREEVYTGGCLDLAPDIIIEFHKIYHVYHQDFHELDKDEFLEKSKWRTGSHSLKGMFLINGESFQENKELSPAEIIDIFPTILYILGEKIPVYLDGKVITQSFKQDFLIKHKIEYTSIQEKFEMKDYRYSEKEKKEIEEKLKSLGYM